MKRTIGIDLGTTNSVVAFAGNEVEILELSVHGKLVPSCVSYRNKEFKIGREALLNLLQYPESTIQSVKRLMGGTINSEMVQSMRKNRDYYGYKITGLTNGTDESVAIEIDGEQFTPEQISSEILKELKLRAEEYLQAEITDVVITVPAYFTPKQKNATQLAAEYAGLKVKKLLSEPLAAAIAYGVDNVDQGEVKTLIVYDFGGGTFDLSILKIANNGQGIFESESATGGDRWLGGDDIDMILYKLITKKVSAQYGIQDFDKLVEKLPLKRKIRFKSLMNDKTEKAKILLSGEQKARIELMGLLEDENNDIIDIDIEIRREEFENAIRPTIKKTIDFIDKLMSESHCTIDEINGILLVGGSSCIPLVKTMLVENYGNSKIVISGKPFFAIAEGAAIMANREDPGEGGITNHNFYLGFQNAEGKAITKKVIDSGTPLPVSVKVPLKTTSNNQKIVLLPYHGADAGSSTLYVEHFLANDPSANYGPYIPYNYSATNGLAISGTNFGLPPCLSIGVATVTPFPLLATHEKITQKLIPYQSDSTMNDFNGQYSSWQAMNVDTTMTDSSAVLGVFNTLAANSRFAYLTNVEQALATGNVPAAAAQLSAAPSPLVGSGVSTDLATGVNVADDSTSNFIVNNYMAFYGVYIDYIKDSMSSSDSASLLYIAALCPVQYGAAVYRARSLYTAVFNDLRAWNDDSCSTAADSSGLISSRHSNSDSTTISAGLSQRYDLFPNPNDGMMTLTQMVQDNNPVNIDVSDVVGRSVYKNSIVFADGNYKLNVGNLVPGVYLMQLTDAKGRKFMFKFVKE